MTATHGDSDPVRERRPTATIVHASTVATAQIAHVFAALGHDVVQAEPADASPIDVIVVDGRLPAATLRIAAFRSACPAARILVLASLDEIALVRAAVEAGASGAVRRPPLRSRILAALETGAVRDAS